MKLVYIVLLLRSDSKMTEKKKDTATEITEITNRISYIC